ncbi:MAG: deazapurine DNA modification protein DpdA family protein [Candidatus Helarchaeota archaeon]
MNKLEFFAVCHTKMDSLNKGINSISRKVNLLVSYSQIYKNNKNEIELPKNRKKLMIDSGAFDLLEKRNLEEYPFTPKDYVNAIKNLSIKPDYVVSLDYICKKNQHTKNILTINKTINNAVILRNEFKRDEGITFIPVIQGYDLDEYLYCVNQLVKKKIIIDGDIIGIGSLVGRKSSKESQLVIKSIYNFLKERGIIPKIHCFGVNLNVIKDRNIFNIVHSIDSLAWTFPYRFGRVKIFTRERLIEANSNRKLKEPEFYYVSLNSTLNYIDFLNLKYHNTFLEKSLKINEVFKIKNEKDLFNAYKKIALNFGVNEKILNNINSLNALKDCILKLSIQNKKRSTIKIDIIPVYTGNKIIFLEPKCQNVDKFEFLYLFVSSIKNAFLDLSKKTRNYLNIFLKILREFYSSLDKKYLNIIYDVLSEFNLQFIFKNLIDFDFISNKIDEFLEKIDLIIEKLKLKLISFPINEEYKQLNLKGQKIENNKYLLISSL